MHQTRQETTTHLPIPRKGTKYVVRTSSHIDDSVSVLVAVRDMLKIARTAREVKEMIQRKLINLNGRPVRDYHESIRLMNIFQSDQAYVLSILETGKFVLQPTKEFKSRVAKVMNRRLVSKGLFQLNLHDGTNIISKNDVKVGDSLYLDSNNKVVYHIALAKGKEVLVMNGSYQGTKVKISEIKGNKVILKINERNTELNSSQVIAL